MKGIINLALGGLLLVTSGLSFAASQTDLTKDWTCTTNASSSSVATEQAADQKLSETKASASNSFSAAAANCRDCTKITCEIND